MLSQRLPLLIPLQALYDLRPLLCPPSVLYLFTTALEPQVFQLKMVEEGVAEALLVND
jgi:hypothetical protein